MWRQENVFFIQGNVAFNVSLTQSIPTSNEQMMKTKLRTFARKQILRKPIKKLVKKWLKYSVHMNKHNVNPVGLYENTL